MKRYLALVFLLITVPAEAKFRSVSDWADLPSESRAFYVAGVRDFMAMYASRGKGPIAARLHTCLGATRFEPAATADFILESTALRKDVAKSNAAGFVLNYIKNDCKSPSADTKPAKSVVPYKEFAALTLPLQASYVEGIRDTLEAFSHSGESEAKKLRECMTRNGLSDANRLADGVAEYAKLNGSRVEANLSFAEVTLFYLVTRCK